MRPEFEAPLDRLADAAEALAGELELEAVLQTIAETAAMVTGARYAALGVLGRDETISRFITHGVSEEQIRAIGHYPTGKGILGLLIREPRTIRLDDVQEHPASYGFPAHHPPMTTFLGRGGPGGGRVEPVPGIDPRADRCDRPTGPRSSRRRTPGRPGARYRSSGGGEQHAALSRRPTVRVPRCGQASRSWRSTYGRIPPCR